MTESGSNNPSQRGLLMLARQILPLFILCFVCIIAQAQTLTGEGYGKNAEAARNEALATLASSIFVQIESSTKSYMDSKGVDLTRKTRGLKKKITLVAETADTVLLFTTQD